jgi:hypothetical protein
MKHNNQIKVLVYIMIVLVYVSQSKRLSKYIPSNINNFLRENYADILVVCYLVLMYYYSGVKY